MLIGSSARTKKINNDKIASISDSCNIECDVPQITEAFNVFPMCFAEL